MSVGKESLDSTSSSNENKPRYNHNKPTVTERKGLITSRVGQGYYRQRVLEKWDNKCSVTGCEITKILISSHIVSWKNSNDEERLDPDNGLLLSPDLDGLFDRHLISFEDDGSIIISNTITESQINLLGVNKKMKLRFVNKEMKKYLKRHRDKLIS